MAFNWRTFRTRTLTAAVFVAVMLTGLLWNQWSFLVLFSVIHFGCWWEYIKLIEKIYTTIFHAYIKLGFMVLGYGIVLWFCGPNYHINHYDLKENFSLPISIAGFGLIIAGIFQKNRIQLKSFAAVGLGLAYISLSWGLIIDLSDPFREPNILYFSTPTHLPEWPLLIIISLWINDTMAYIIGSLIGKTPLTKISPKKTWEGTLGGILLCMTVVYITAGSINGYSNKAVMYYCVIAAIASVSGTFGDLFESKLKRMADVKDSGRIMPGHGGFLDRFDSLLFAIPAVWIFITLFS